MDAPLLAAGMAPRSTLAGAASPPYPAPRASRTAHDIPGLLHGLVPVADDVRLHYVMAGEGEPVLLIPGWPQSWYAWRFMIPLLAAVGRRVYAVDPRGFGDSDKPEQRPDRAQRTTDRQLLGDIQLLHAEQHDRHGSPRVHAALRTGGRTANCGRVERLMRATGTAAQGWDAAGLSVVHRLTQEVQLRTLRPTGP